MMNFSGRLLMAAVISVFSILADAIWDATVRFQMSS